MAAPVAPAAGDLADATFWTAEVYQRWVDLLASWTAYTPTWTCSVTNPAIGNGTLSGRYKAVGKTVWFSLRFLAGSTTTFGDGLWSFSLPVAPTAVQSCPGVAIGPSSGRYPLACWLSTSTGIFRMITTAGSGGVRTNAGASNDVPFEWASGHQIILGGCYESN